MIINKSKIIGFFGRGDIMDEVTYVVELLKGTNIATSQYGGTNTWAGSISSLSIPAAHQVTPTIIDIRNMTKNKGRAYDLSTAASGESSSDLIVVFEDSQTLNYPTVPFNIRNETYTLTLHIRTIQDDRGASDANFARNRLENLYKIVQHRIDANRKGAKVTVSGDSNSFDLIYLRGRTESNDRAKRLFGYKVQIELQKYAVALP